MLPLLLLGTAIYYVRRNELGGVLDSRELEVTAHAMLLPVFFVHVILTGYVYGLIRPRRTLRVFHIYLGYLTFVVTMLSQAGITHGTARDLWTVLMYVTIVAHIAIGVRYGVARHGAAVVQRSFATQDERAEGSGRLAGQPS